MRAHAHEHRIITRRPSRRRQLWALPLALSAFLLVNCGGSTGNDPSGTGGGAGVTSGGSGGSGAASGGSAGATGCSGSAPMCAAGCGSDWFPETASCVANAWKCPAGTVLPKDCPSGTCWGLPLPGETCGPSGWQCKPELDDIASCPALLCATCEGFDGPLNTTNCNCRCENGQVECGAQANPTCEIISNFCECKSRIDCAPVTEDCFCECDAPCAGDPPCDCFCGGGKFLSCADKNSDD